MLCNISTICKDILTHFTVKFHYHFLKSLLSVCMFHSWRTSLIWIKSLYKKNYTHSILCELLIVCSYYHFFAGIVYVIYWLWFYLNLDFFLCCVKMYFFVEVHAWTMSSFKTFKIPGRSSQVLLSIKFLNSLYHHNRSGRQLRGQMKTY